MVVHRHSAYQELLRVIRERMEWTPRKGKEGFLVEHGVQCETCHGAGSEYKSRKIMKDHDASVAAGMIAPDQEFCEPCHNDRSPTFEGFDFEKMWAEVSHPNPKKAAAAE